MIPPETIRAVLSQWNLSLKTIRTDCDLQGSPERSIFRTACEDEAGRLFVVEQIAPDRRERRQLISTILDNLFADGLKQVIPYLSTPAGQSLAFCEDAWWQASPFVAGTPLDRSGYLHDAGKGESLAQFLRDLSRYAQRLFYDRNATVFSLKDYILKLEQDINRHASDVAPRFASIFDFLRRSFMDAYDTLPATFCHGDFHPLNVIWRGGAIAAVIDWEFCGLKPEIYDAANLIGCVGIEHPSGLTGDLAAAFIQSMRESSSISAASWKLFPEFAIALRCAWLAEWLRGKDEEMIDLEESYMHLLIDNLDELREAWGMPGTAK
ncbi:MAG: phosphotransferase [Syntrophaceae bacterium]|nr:phosphotransferase [Syntrophaceae bacterium]